MPKPTLQHINTHGHSIDCRLFCVLLFAYYYFAYYFIIFSKTLISNHFRFLTEEVFVKNFFFEILESEFLASVRMYVCICV